MNKQHDMLLANGKVVEFNLQDALEVLTETEMVILDMLVTKVLDHSEQKEAVKFQGTQNINNIINTLSQQFGLSPLEVIQNKDFFNSIMENVNQQEQKKPELQERKNNFGPFIFTEYIPQP